MGDGEMDEPESLGAISLAGREGLDNLVFVINCNPQRLDGPVRGNGKIVQELESVFRGAGWNVIKVLWGGGWDALFARTRAAAAAADGGMRRRRVPGLQEQERRLRANASSAATRRPGARRRPERRRIWNSTCGGYDPQKVLPPTPRSVAHRSAHADPAQDSEGYGMGESGEGQMISHQAKEDDGRRAARFRDRFQIPVSDDLAKVPFIKLPGQAGDEVPARAPRSARRLSAAAALHLGVADDPAAVELPAPARQFGEREISTTMAFVQMPARWCATRTSASTSCRSCRTSRAPSAWKACSASSASTRRSASSTSPGRRPADVLPRVQGRAGAAGGINEGGAMSAGCRRHLVQHEQRADDPVLHLLDVRPAARRRPGLAGR